MKAFRLMALVSLMGLPILLNGVHASTLLTDPQAAQAKIDYQNQYFARAHVEQTAPNVYTAVGYHGATTSMIVGTDGVIMIDSLFGPKSANDAFDALRKAAKTDLPVKAIIYTHSHEDHIGGAAAYAKYGKDVMVIGPAGMGHSSGSDPSVNTGLQQRGILQFGRTLPKEQQSNRGVAPAITYDKDKGQGFIKPTHIVQDKKEIEISGVKLYIEKAAGETNDAMFIWLPKERVMFTGDNFYKAFPNLYALRGTPYRDVRVWAKSVARMARFQPEYVIPGHTTPIKGQRQATGALLDYSRAIQSVFEQTVAGINRLEDMNTIAQNVKLPEDLVNKPWLSEVYGNVENASRAIYVGLVGWFDGQPKNLHPLSNVERANRTVQLLGGRDAAMKAIESAFAQQDWQWTLELISDMKDAHVFDNKDRETLKKLEIETLRAIAKHESNPVNRNWYLGWSNRLEKSGQ